MRQWSDAILVGQVHVRAVLDQEIDDLLVRRIAVSEDDGLEQGCPTQSVHVVDIDIGLVEQVPDDLDVAALAGGDQGRPAEAVREGRVGARFVDESQDVEQALGAGVEERVVLSVVLEVDVRASFEERPHGVDRPAIVAASNAVRPVASLASTFAPPSSAAVIAATSPEAAAARS